MSLLLPTKKVLFTTAWAVKLKLGLTALGGTTQNPPPPQILLTGPSQIFTSVS